MLYGYCAKSCVGARLGAEYCEGVMLDAVGTRTRFSVLGAASSVPNQLQLAQWQVGTVPTLQGSGPSSGVGAVGTGTVTQGLGGWVGLSGACVCLYCGASGSGMGRALTASGM